jgi:hypothetical protein
MGLPTCFAWEGGKQAAPIFHREGGIVRLTLDLELPDALSNDLHAEAKRRGMTAQQWAAEQLEVNLASTRLPYVDVGRYGARMHAEKETEPLALIEHRILI